MRRCLPRLQDYKTSCAAREGGEPKPRPRAAIPGWPLSCEIYSEGAYDDEICVEPLPTYLDWISDTPEELILPFNKAETHRIKRTLLCYELFCPPFTLDKSGAWRSRKMLQFSCIREPSASRTISLCLASQNTYPFSTKYTFHGGLRTEERRKGIIIHPLGYHPTSFLEPALLTSPNLDCDDRVFRRFRMTFSHLFRSIYERIELDAECEPATNGKILRVGVSQ